MNTHELYLNDEEWKDYVMGTALQRYSQLGFDEAFYSRGPYAQRLRIIRIEDGLVELGFAPQEDPLRQETKYINECMAGKLNVIFSGILQEECHVHALPVIVE